MDKVLSSQALLIASKTSKHPDIVEIIRKRIVGYMTATKYECITIVIVYFVSLGTCYSYMMIQYNVLRRWLSEAVKVTSRFYSFAFLLIRMIMLHKITPGKRSPTISSLDGDEDGNLYMLIADSFIYVLLFLIAVAVSALVLRKDSSSIMDQLEKVGATDILLFAINNSRM